MTASRPLELILSQLSSDLTLVDVGARWGASSAWTKLGDRASVICFEPDADEAARLQQACPANVKYLPVALGGMNGTSRLHVTREPACSSIYPPIQTLYAEYPDLAIIAPDRTIEVPVRKLDDVIAEQGSPSVDILKLDTQGSELDILRGGTETLKTVSVIDIELEFNALYAGQNLFCDVDRFLRDCGFVLWRITELVHYSTGVLPGGSQSLFVATNPGRHMSSQVDNGQLFWAQGQYVRAEFPRTGSPSFGRDKAVRAAALVGVYGFWDLAVDILKRGGEEPLARLVTEAISDLDQINTPLDQTSHPEVTNPEPANTLEATTGSSELLEARLAATEALLRESEERLMALQSSRSWRLTAPIRALKRRLV